MRKLSSVLVGLACLGGLTVIGPAPASAAIGTCNGVDVISLSTTHFGAPANGSSITCVLGSGNANPAVRALQRHLNRCYQQGLAGDGIYGPNTAAAVRNVQRIENVPVDGVYGPQTRDAMKFAWYYNSNDNFAGCGPWDFR